MPDEGMPIDGDRPDQRRYPRFPASVPIRIRVPNSGGSAVKGTVRNMGAGGLMAECLITLAQGVAVELTLTTRAGPLTLDGRVVWAVAAESDIRHGVAFG